MIFLTGLSRFISPLAVLVNLGEPSCCLSNAPKTQYGELTASQTTGIGRRNENDLKLPAMNPESAHHASVTLPEDEWKITWESAFQTHQYEPIYLANGSFGGMLDLSGATMDLWSSRIGSVPDSGALADCVTMTR